MKKCEHLHVTRKVSPTPVETEYLGNTAQTPAIEIKYLRIMIDSYLSFDQHIIGKGR